MPFAWFNFIEQFKTESMSKPIKVKPALYSLFYQSLKEIAAECGYNLVLHGSMNRDLDLIAIPWDDHPTDHAELLIKMEEFLTGKVLTGPDGNPAECRDFTKLPGGRLAYTINLNRGNRKGEWMRYADEEYYLDISFTPYVQHNYTNDSKHSNT